MLPDLQLPQTITDVKKYCLENSLKYDISERKTNASMQFPTIL